MARQRESPARKEAQRRQAAKERRGQPAPTLASASPLQNSEKQQSELWIDSRAGARSGRGFRFQDLFTTLVALELWRDGDAMTTVVPEGFDDVSVDRTSGTHSIQVKSRRETVGDFTNADLRRHLRSVARAWISRCDAGLSLQTTLLLERPVIGLELPEWPGGLNESTKADLTREILDVSLRGSIFPDDQSAAEFAESISVAVCSNPRERAIAAATTTREVPESVAEIIVAEICSRVGAASDANADREAEDRAGLLIGEMDAIVDRILETVDLDLLDEARALGVCESIGWNSFTEATPIHGAHIGAAQVVSGQLISRPTLTSQVTDLLETRRLAVIAGPSGSGKSALSYMAAYNSRAFFRWQQVFSIAPTGRNGRDAIALLSARIESLRPSTYAPIGILIDDAGRHDPEMLDRVLRRLTGFPDVVVIVSVREEDRFPVPLLASVATISPTLDSDFAEELWRHFHSNRLTSWEGWREPYERSNGLLLEYISVLTEGDSLESIVRAQINVRESDPARIVELEVLRVVSCANQYGVRVSVEAVRSKVGANLTEFTIAYRRLVDEHLIIEVESGLLGPLHELRSASLARASHPFGQGETLRDLVALLPVDELARFLRRALEDGADRSGLLRAAAIRASETQSLRTFVAVVSAFRSDGLRCRADQWKQTLDACGVKASDAVTAFMISRTQPRPDNDELFKPEVVRAVARLRNIPTEPDMPSVWDALDELNIDQLFLTHLANHASPTLVLQALSSIRGIDASVLANIADGIGSKLSDWQLDDAASAIEALRRIAPNLAARAVDQAHGEQSLLLRMRAETPWMASLERDEVGILGKWLFVDEELQKDGHEAVVEACRRALTLAPSAAIARVSAVSSTGQLSMITPDYPLADKEIPRENLPHSFEVAENRAQARALSRKYGSGSHTAKLAAEAKTLNSLLEILPEVLTAHLSDRHMKRPTIRIYEEAVELLTKLDAPAEKEYEEEIPGTLGTYPSESAVVTVARGILQHVIPNLTKKDIANRDSMQAAAILDNLIPKAASLIELDRYRYLPEPPNCAALLDTLERLRVVANASAAKDSTVRSAMGAAARHHPGSECIAAAAAVAAARAAPTLEKEAARMEGALLDRGFNVTVASGTSENQMMSWPPGDLFVTVQGISLMKHAEAIEELAHASRESSETPDRRIWIGLRTSTGYLPASIFQVVRHGVLPLANRAVPAYFSNVLDPTPVSALYTTYLISARRISAIAAIIVVRGTDTVTEEESRTLEESWELLVRSKATIYELTATYSSSDYVAALKNLLATIQTALADDLATAVTQVEIGETGWEFLKTLRSLDMLNVDQASTPNSDAAIIYATALVVADIEDDFENADRRVEEMES